MRLDRFVLNILGWLKKLLHKEERGDRQLEIYESKTSIDGVTFRGVLQLIKRDEPRAIRTWRYLPLGGSRENILICLDTLDRLPNERGEDDINEIRTARSYPRRNTHRITIISANHFLGPDGDFEGDVLFTGYYHFGVTHRWAIAALDDLAYLVPFRWEREDGAIQWEEEIVASRLSKWMGRN